MTGQIASALVCLLTAGCEASDWAGRGPGPNAAYAGQTDSLRTTTRRLQAGDSTDYQVAPLPDGRRIVVTDWDGTADLGIRDLVTGEFRRLTDNTAPYLPGEALNPRVSRDGQRIAYLYAFREGSKPRELRVMGVDGSEPRVIYRTTDRIEAEDWSPDGRSILAWRSQEDGTKQIVLIPVDGGTVRTLRTLDWRAPVRMNFSPDGRYIVYDFPTREHSNLDRDLYVLDLANGRESTLIEHPANDFVLGWAPDGHHVLFASDRGGTRGAWIVEVRRGKAVAQPRLVRPDLWKIDTGAFAPDGSFFFHVNSSTRGLYIAHLDPKTGAVIGSPTLLPNSDGEVAPRWSPDGRMIASRISIDPAPVYAYRGEQSAIRIRSLETGEARDLPVPADLRSPVATWSPEGRWLLVRAQEKSRYGLWRMDPQSGRIVTLFKLPARVSGGFTLKPDGRTLVSLISERAPREGVIESVLFRDLETGRDSVLCRRAVSGPRRLNGALSGDASLRSGLLYDEPSHSLLLTVQTLDELCSGRWRTLLTLPGPEGVYAPVAGSILSPDGRTLYYRRRIGTNPQVEVWRIGIEGGATKPIGLGMPGLDYLQVSPDGRSIAFAAREERDELWVMENFLPGRVAAAQGR